MLTHFLISLLFSCNLTLAKTIEPLQRGENLVEQIYRLPMWAGWNGEGKFENFHFLKNPNHKPVCNLDGVKEICKVEDKRVILVEYNNTSYPSKCRYQDCYVDFIVPNSNELLIDMSNITSASLVDDESLPYIRNQSCSGSSMNMIAPGYSYDSLKLYKIYMKVYYTETTTVNGETTNVRKGYNKALGMLPDGRCDSFVTHKYTSSPNDY
ncbi:hypothetical protein DSO57_1001321 [Entomophthora muscae]|uniref:Uncharacterized protein n=1 Tax=Entomophthora muscae TaxID=34485 RepID=A0ACC2U791_9FUNG|nr:hypothetical protein DSO57_1001321 [Entomophthora muscae]